MRWALAFLLSSSACSWEVDFGDTNLACPDDRCPAGQACVAGRCEAIPADASAPPPWWDDSYAMRRRVRIHNGSDEVAARDLPVFVIADLSDLAIPDYDQLRVAHHDGQTWRELPFYAVFQDTHNAVWFRLPDDIAPHSVDESTWFYSSNPSAPPRGGSGEGVFERVEYFDTLSSTLWDSTGAVDVTAGKLAIGPGGQLRSKQAFAPPIAVDVATDGTQWQPMIFLGFQRTDDFTDSEPFARWMYTSGGLVPQLEIAATGAAAWSGTASTVLATRIDVGVDRASDRVHYWLGEQSVAERALDAPFDAPLQIRMGNGGTGTLSIASLRVRKSAAVLPDLTLGAAEAR